MAAFTAHAAILALVAMSFAKPAMLRRHIKITLLNTGIALRQRDCRHILQCRFHRRRDCS